MKKIVLVGILLIIVIATIGFLDFLLNKPGSMGALSPKEVYLALKTEAATAQDLDGMVGIYKKYLTASFFRENNIRVQDIPVDQKIQVFEKLKSLVVPLSDINIETISEDIIGDNAIVIVYTKNYAGVGTVNLAKENGIWKVNSSEKWVGGKR